ncbi:unnamed protein product, partial [Scytosiphon promiscuus]
MLSATTGGGKPGGGKRKHKMAVEVVDGTMRVVLPRVINDRRATVKDIQAAVQDRLRKRRKNEQDSYPLVTEIRERHKRSKVDTGLLLDDDEALSDLMDSDAEEGTTFIAVLNGEVGSAGAGSGSGAGPGASSPSAGTAPSVSGAAAGAEFGKDGGGVAPGTTVAPIASMVTPSVPPASGKSPPGSGKGKGKNKAEVPHKIPYTVAGLPRGGGGRRGPREGVVTTTVTSSLRDLKQAIAKDVGVCFTPDASPLSTSGQPDTRLKIKVTVAPNVTVELKLFPTQTVRDLWRMVDRVARAADAARSESGKGDDNQGSTGDDAGAEVVAAAAAAAAAAEDAYTTVPGGDDDDDNTGSEGDPNAAAKDDFFLPRGQLLMRQATRSSAAPRNMFLPSRLLAEDGAGDFLCFPEDVLGTKGSRGGRKGCGLRDGNELILVGPGAITPESIPAWAAHVLVLGQKVGCISIPNRRLAEEIGDAGRQQPQESTASTTTVGEGAGGEGRAGSADSSNDAARAEGAVAEEGRQMRTLGDLRKLLSKELELDADRMDLWIAPPPQTDGTAGGSKDDASNSAHDKEFPGTGMVPEQPRGARASFDSMSLGHYGLDHGGVVDVRVRPTSWEAASGSGATNEMMLRGAEGVVLFLSKSTFGLLLLKRLATRALTVPLSLVTRCSFDKQDMHTFANPSVQKWLKSLGREVRSSSALVVYVNKPTPAPRNQLGRSTGAVYQPPKAASGDDSAPAASDSDSEDDELAGDPVRTSVALWVEEPNIDGGDPLGVGDESLSSLDATVYPLRSTFESDGTGLEEWGLLREGVRVFAVFYMTRSPLSASEAGKNRLSGREGAFGTSLCWHSRPVPPPSSNSSKGYDDVDGGGSATTTRGRRSKPEKPEDDDSEVGQACFLSCAYMLCDHVRKLQEMAYEGMRDYRDVDDDDEKDDRSLGWLLRELMALLSPRFPPAALALSQLAEAEDVTDAECACLVQCLWGLAREMVPASVADESVLENSRAFLSWLVSRASTARDDADKELARELAIAKRKKA